MKKKTYTAYKRAYNEKAYDRLSIMIPKGRKEDIEAVAKERGTSVNGMVNELLRDAASMSITEWRSTEESKE